MPSWAQYASLYMVPPAQDVPISADDAQESFSELWEKIESAPRTHEMTDEEAMELALEAQRWAREQLRLERNNS